MTETENKKSWRQALLGAKMDLTPLRTSRDFRILFISGTIFYLGAMFGYVAVPYQLYELTGSNLAVGAMGVVQLVPLLIFGLSTEVRWPTRSTDARWCSGPEWPSRC